MTRCGTDSRHIKESQELPVPPLLLSELMISHPEVATFAQFLVLVRNRAQQSDRIFLELDLKPEYPDTPRNWAFLVEAAYTGGKR